MQHGIAIGVRIDPPETMPDDVWPWLTGAAAFDAAGADALWLDLTGTDLDPCVLVASLAALTYRTRLVLDANAHDPRSVETLGMVSRGRLETASPQDWVDVPMPDSRATWRETLADAAAKGSTGVIVPADPRLLDLLRNPDEEIDRRDLHLAQG